VYCAYVWTSFLASFDYVVRLVTELPCSRFQAIFKSKLVGDSILYITVETSRSMGIKYTVGYYER